MSSNPLGIQSFGAFTPGAAQQIASAIAAAGIGMTGTIYYLDPVNGIDGNTGLTIAAAVKTLGVGYAKLASGKNDVLVLIGNGAASGSARISAGFTWAKDAAHLVGVCAPSAVSQRARIAPFTGAAQAAFANFFTVSGNGCLFSNVSWFHGFTAGIAAAICMTVTGQRNVFSNCDIEGMGDAVSAGDAGSRNLKVVGGENTFYHCNIGLDTITRTNANSSVEFASGTARNTFENCTFPFMSGDGNTLGILGTGAACMDRWQIFRNCIFVNAIKSTATVMTVLASLTNVSPGGLLAYHNCLLVGVTAFGDTLGLANSYSYGAVNSTANSKAANPA